MTTAGALQQLAVPLRRWRRLTWAAAIMGSVVASIAIAALIVKTGVVSHPAWVLVAWIVAATAAVVLSVGASRDTRFTPSWLARDLESRALWRSGGLLGLLEDGAAGTSASLREMADQCAALELSQRGADALQPVASGVRRQAGWAGGLLLISLGGFALLGPSRGSTAALWHPALAWKATLSPVSLAVSRTDVMRGDSVTLSLEAYGRHAGTLWTRAPGESWRAEAIGLDSAGRASRIIGPLQSDLFLRLSSGGKGSDTLQIRVRVPAFLGSLSLTAHYPRYLKLEDEPLPTGGDTLVLPAGTRLEVKGEATAALTHAEWTSDAGDHRWPLEVEGSHLSGGLTPGSSGTIRLSLTTADGVPLASAPVSIPLKVVPDLAPTIEVPVPGTDTVLPASLRLTLVLDARDDHGLSKVTIETRRHSRLGFVDSAQFKTVPLPGTDPDRAILTWPLDLLNRGLLPGDSVHLIAHATDNSPAGLTARSREYVFRVPAEDELRAATRQAAQAIAGRLDSLSKSAKALERQTGDLAQERAREGQQKNGAEDPALSFDAAKRGETVAAEQEKLQRQAEEVRRMLEQLQQSAKAAGVNDPAFEAQLKQIQSELDRALTPELRQKLAALQQALKSLDPEQSRDALSQLADAQKQLKEALERSKELFRRAALEGDMANAAAEAKDLARQQESWSAKAPSADSTQAAAAEKQLAARADSLSSALQQLSSQVDSGGAAEKMEQAGQQAAQSAQQMKSAAGQMQKGQRKAAAEQGKQAADKLKPLGEQLDQARQEQQQQWREEVVAGLDAALSDASRLTASQLELSERLRRGENGASVRAAQGAIEEGTERLSQALKNLAGKNALVPPATGQGLAQAQRMMQQSREAISSPSPSPRDAADKAGAAVDALNASAYQLVRARGDVSGAGSGSGMAEAMEKMQQLAGQQGQVGQQAGGLLPMMGAQGGGSQSQLQQLAAQQRAISQQLERLKASGDAPGAGAMAEEAGDLAKRLEAGQLDRQTVERQEHLFRRMLDAGRTLQGQEQDDQKERQSTTATGDSVHLPPALEARLRDVGGGLKLPSWETLQRFSPEERRLVMEYFRRLTEAPKP
ncbi:MAG: hypothetical protein ABI765_00125 [Gemmatimonadota bacterium]